MKKWGIVLIILVQWIATEASASEDSVNLLYFQPQIGLQAPRIFTQGKTSSYSGKNYSGSIYYKIGDDQFAWAPLLSYGIGFFDNLANNGTDSEKITENTISTGVKFYFGNWFFGASYSWVKFKDVATGLNNKTLSDSSTGLGGVLGFEINLSEYFLIEIAGNVMNANFKANTGGFSSDAQYLRYGGTLGLSFLLPSSAPKKSFFKTPGSRIR